MLSVRKKFLRTRSMCYQVDCDAPGRLCSLAGQPVLPMYAFVLLCFPWTCLFHCATHGRVYSIAGCAAWTCLLYSSLCCGCPWTCPCPGPRPCLCCPGGVWPTAACAAPGTVRRQMPVLHLTMHMLSVRLNIFRKLRIFFAICRVCEKQILRMLRMLSVR
jgi:hypothetical protein